MKRFIHISLLFFLPIILVCLPCLTLSYMGGELYPNARYVKPLKEGQLFGLAYTDMTPAYKYKMTDEVFRPDIICLGSSRIMKVGKEVINKDYSFYNAGGAINNIYHYQQFLSKLHYTPKLLFISLDQWFFNPNFTNQEKTFSPNTYDFPERNMGLLLMSFMDGYMAGKIHVGEIIDNKRQHIGFNAILNDNGFLMDGFHYEGNLIMAPQSGEDFNFRNTFSRIAEGNRRFEYCDQADTNHVKVIGRFLQSCQEKGIAVLAILPPFAPAVNKNMTDSGHYGYLSQLYGLLKPVFTSHKNCFVYDYTDMSGFCVDNKDFVDGFHGSEFVYDTIVLDILQQNDTISGFFANTVEIEALMMNYKKKNIKYHDL